MTTPPSNDVARKVNDTRRTRSPLAWALGVLFLIVLLAIVFFYNGRDANTAAGTNTPPVINNRSGSK